MRQPKRAVTFTDACQVLGEVEFVDFNQITRSKTVRAPRADVRELEKHVDVLLVSVFPTDKGIRLLGVTLSSLERLDEELEPQLLLALD
jgi:DNA polymerase-4